MDVEKYIEENICEGCDCDPAKCLNQKYCEYDRPEDDTVEFALKEAHER